MKTYKELKEHIEDQQQLDEVLGIFIRGALTLAGFLTVWFTGGRDPFRNMDMNQIILGVAGILSAAGVASFAINRFVQYAETKAIMARTAEQAEAIIQAAIEHAEIDPAMELRGTAKRDAQNLLK